MLYHNVQVTAHALRFIDSIALAAATAAAWYAGYRADAWPLSTASAIPVFVLVLVVAFLAIGARLRIYHAWRTEDVADEFMVLSEVTLYAVALACLATEMTTPGLSGNGYLAMVIVALVAIVGLRLFLRLGIRRLRSKGKDMRNWLIVGHNSRSSDMAREILRNPHYGIRIAEIIDVPDPSGGNLEERRRFEIGLPEGVSSRVVDSVERLREIVAERVIDEVVVMLPVRSHYDTVSRVLEICVGAGISVRLRPQAFETEGYDTQMSYVGKIPLVTHYSGPSNYWQLVIKRLVDVIGATAGLVILLPFYAGVAVAIKMGSPGPVFFRQTRVGLHGRHFEMFKFRSMVQDAPKLRDEMAVENERDGTAFKIKNDSRITPVGKWLRKYHIDEFPQLWNVLVGDMSLVGPRPLPVKEANGNEWWQRRRLTMPPGLTCLWQLEDDPHMPFREWMELDIAYIDRWSIWLDLKLIFRTFATVLRGNGW